jgi:hypothetical protein
LDEGSGGVITVGGVETEQCGELYRMGGSLLILCRRHNRRRRQQQAEDAELRPPSGRQARSPANVSYFVFSASHGPLLLFVFVAQTAVFAVCGFSFRIDGEAADLKNGGPRYPASCWTVVGEGPKGTCPHEVTAGQGGRGLGANLDLDPVAFSIGRVHGRRPVRYSETFQHPDVAVDDPTLDGEVAAVR